MWKTNRQHQQYQDNIINNNFDTNNNTTNNTNNTTININITTNINININITTNININITTNININITTINSCNNNDNNNNTNTTNNTNTNTNTEFSVSPLSDRMMLRPPPSTQFRFVVDDGTAQHVVDCSISSSKAKVRLELQRRPVKLSVLYMCIT
jgi:hypothetical protein